MIRVSLLFGHLFICAYVSFWLSFPLLILGALYQGPVVCPSGTPLGLGSHTPVSFFPPPKHKRGLSSSRLGLSIQRTRSLRYHIVITTIPCLLGWSTNSIAKVDSIFDQVTWVDRLLFKAFFWDIIHVILTNGAATVREHPG